jgi:hypothetical protein
MASGTFARFFCECTEADRTTTYSLRLTTYLKTVEIPEALTYNANHPGERSERRAG